MSYQTHQHDCLVIGAGGAGLRAAIEAALQGCSVGLICKSLLGKAHTVMAEGGVAAALANTDERDSWQVHFRDTMRGGKLLNNWRMAQIHAQEAPARVNELEAWGALFDRTQDGRILQRNFGGHQYPRLAHVGDRTGLEIIRTLQDYCVHQRNVNIFMEYTVTHLLKEAGRIAGCFAYNRQTGEFHLFKTKAVVMATGGIGKSFRVTSNSWEYTGDGHSLAFYAGAELIDMEFVQFHPTGMVWPLSVKGTLVTEGVRGEGGVLKNSKGERFMFRYVPEMFKGEFADTEAEAKRWLTGDKTARRPPELLTRDVVARAIRAEVKAGCGSPHGGVFLDIASQRGADDIKRKLPSMYHQFKELANVDITQEAMEVGPTCHYMMGGVKVDAETCAATVPGLFAAGECAGGLHGANRLGGNSLSDLLVFGRRAGLGAAGFAKKQQFAEVEIKQADLCEKELLGSLERERGENPFAVMEDLQKIMENHCGIIREKKELRAGLEALEEIKIRAANTKASGDRRYHAGWHSCLDLKHMLTVSEAMIRAAIERRESRGAHTREDFSESSPEFGQINIVIHKEGENMKVSKRKLPDWPAEVKALIKK